LRFYPLTLLGIGQWSHVRVIVDALNHIRIAVPTGPINVHMIMVIIRGLEYGSTGLKC